jgi:CPA2 family monovalent cation:H+ antiporter-2
MHHLDLIFTLTGGFIAALAFGYFTQRIGLSPIVGYLLAGIAVSPHTPGFVASTAMAEQLAEIGVILLMFGVGLQFHFQELLAVKRIAIPGALVQSLVATVLATVIMHALGWGWSTGIVFGLAISVASTVVLTRVLEDHGDLHTPTGHVSIGWLVMEDLFTVFVLVLLPALFGASASTPGDIALAVGWATLKIGALGALTFVIGGWAIPRVLTHIAKTGSRELFTLAVLAIALGIAVGSSVAFGVSMALGAFLAGMVVGRSEFSVRAATEALPMRDAFAVLFFVSVGMLFDWKSFIETPGLVAATMGVILIGKPLAAIFIVLLLRYPLRVALSVAIVLGQIGEFSFIVATLGRQLNILPESATHVLVAAAIGSITLNPLLYRAVGPFEKQLTRFAPGWVRWLEQRAGRGQDTKAAAQPPTSHLRAVVVGYGPVGQTVTRLLKENKIEPTVVELNVDTVQQLLAEGAPAVYGDAARIDTLAQAGVATARALVLSASSIRDGQEIIRRSRELNPRLRVIARTAYLRELTELRAAGADLVFSGEGEVALAMTEAVLKDLGATQEQIERERRRVHDKLFGVVVGPEDAPHQNRSSAERT